jgi:hypothetical protein
MAARPLPFSVAHNRITIYREDVPAKHLDPMPLYHCSLAWLEPGSIIRPGNYGRVVRLAGLRHRDWMREQFLEFVRSQEFPDKPSRLSSAFACEELAAAEYFKESNCQTGIIYEVQMVDPATKTHVTDFNCIQPIGQGNGRRRPSLLGRNALVRNSWPARPEMRRDTDGMWIKGRGGSRIAHPWASQGRE